MAFMVLKRDCKKSRRGIRRNQSCLSTRTHKTAFSYHSCSENMKIIKAEAEMDGESSWKNTQTSDQIDAEVKGDRCATRPPPKGNEKDQSSQMVLSWFNPGKSKKKKIQVLHMADQRNPEQHRPYRQDMLPNISATYS